MKCFLISFLLLTTGLNTFADESCSELFSKKDTFYFRGMTNYLTDVKNSYGLRLAFKDSVPKAALLDKLIDLPINSVSQKIFKTKKDFTLLIKIPLIAAIVSTSFQVFDSKILIPIKVEQIEQQLYTDANKNAAIYDNLITTDFRFHNIRINRDDELSKSSTSKADSTSLEEKIELPKVKARIQAAYLLRNYENYYKILDSIKNVSSLTLEEHQKYFGQNPLFEEVQFIIQDEIKKYEGAVVAKPGPLTSRQKLELYRQTHILYAKYRLIENVFALSMVSQKYQNYLDSDPFFIQLLELEKNGIISKKELIYDLQEDAYDQYYFAVFDILGIRNLKSVNGQYVAQSLTLQDLREEKLRLLRNKNRNQVTSTSSSMR